MSIRNVISYTSLSNTLASGSHDGKKLAYDGLAWFLNVSTSVLIVFVNKLLMDPKKGYGFKFGELPREPAVGPSKNPDTHQLQSTPAPSAAPTAALAPSISPCSL